MIPGHGKPFSNKSELREFRDMLAGIRDSVATLRKAGRTLDRQNRPSPTTLSGAGSLSISGSSLSLCMTAFSGDLKAWIHSCATNTFV
jgi:hypothetical protein